MHVGVGLLLGVTVEDGIVGKVVSIQCFAAVLELLLKLTSCEVKDVGVGSGEFESKGSLIPASDQLIQKDELCICFLLHLYDPLFKVSR